MRVLTFKLRTSLRANYSRMTTYEVHIDENVISYHKSIGYFLVCRLSNIESTRKLLVRFSGTRYAADICNTNSPFRTFDLSGFYYKQIHFDQSGLTQNLGSLALVDRQHKKGCCFVEQRFLGCCAK